MRDLEVEFVGGPRDGLLLELEWNMSTHTILTPVDPACRPEELADGTVVHAWAVPADIPESTVHVKAWYLGETVYESGAKR